jgi:hypothetical protein
MIDFDNHQSASEGWVVADCDGSENGPWQIQKVDEMDVFKSDCDAWAHVVQAAKNGSAYHQAALDFVAEHNPIEWQVIQRFVQEHA